MRNFAIKRGLLVLAFVASILFPAGVNAFYSPADRPTFTWENAASYVTFNSITNNPVAGDERPFLDGKVTTASGNNVDKINVKNSDEVVLRVYFHNNAKASLNLVSTNTKVKILLPKTPKTATYAAGYITSDNANPRVVADTVDFTGDRPFNLEYVPGSARITTNALSNVALSDSIVTDTGALIGYNSLNGQVPGCANFSGWVTIRALVKMEAPPTPPTPPTPTPSPKAPEAPRQLPDTGPAGVIGLFAGVSALAGAGHYIVARRRG